MNKKLVYGLALGSMIGFEFGCSGVRSDYHLERLQDKFENLPYEDDKGNSFLFVDLIGSREGADVLVVYTGKRDILITEPDVVTNIEILANSAYDVGNNPKLVEGIEALMRNEAWGREEN